MSFWIHSVDGRNKMLAKLCVGDTLDIGCGHGNKYLKSVVGFDKFTFELPSNYKALIQGDITNISKILNDGTFDTIYCSDVIEHLHNPVKFIDDCYRLLKDGGTLVLSTDNPYRIQTLIWNVFSRRNTRNLKNTYAVHDYGHVNFWLPRMLNTVCAEAGFDVKKVICSDGFSLPFLEQKLCYVYKKDGKRHVATYDDDTCNHTKK